jgi:hypothetical protein
MIIDREEQTLRTRRLLSAAFWIFIYLLLTLAPLLVLIGTPTPAGRYFLREVSVALGFRRARGYGAAVRTHGAHRKG